MTLERIGLDADGRLVRIPGPDPDDIARVYAVRLRGEQVVVRVRLDVPAPVRDSILALPPDTAFADHEAVRAILAEHEPCTEWDEGRSYVVAAWAADVVASGKVAFYSHSTKNHPSAGVARSLGMRPWKELVAYA